MAITFDDLMNSLPQHPADSVFSQDGENILCTSEEGINAIADLLESIGYDCPVTGFYDPEEDADGGCIDNHTGFYYVSV